MACWTLASNIALPTNFFIENVFDLTIFHIHSRSFSSIVHVAFNSEAAPGAPQKATALVGNGSARRAAAEAGASHLLLRC